MFPGGKEIGKPPTCYIFFFFFSESSVHFLTIHDFRNFARPKTAADRLEAGGSPRLRRTSLSLSSRSPPKWKKGLTDLYLFHPNSSAPTAWSPSNPAPPSALRLRPRPSPSWGSRSTATPKGSSSPPSRTATSRATGGSKPSTRKTTTTAAAAPPPRHQSGTRTGTATSSA